MSGIKLLLPSPKVFASSIFQLKVGQEIDLTTLSETLQKDWLSKGEPSFATGRV